MSTTATTPRSPAVEKERWAASTDSKSAAPGNALEWRKLAADDPDVFLEVISYLETRNYVKVIYEVFNIYRWLYDRTS